MGEKEVISRRGLAKKHAVLDHEVWQWKTKMENIRGSRRVTKNEVQAYALETYKKSGIDNFKASDGWYRRWRQRWQTSNVALNNEVEREGENDSAKDKNLVKVASKDSLEIRNCSEFKIPTAEEVINSTDECITKETVTFCEEKAQLGAYKDLAVSHPIYKASESNIHTDKEIMKDAGTIFKNTLHPSASGLDSLILSVNFLKAKKSKSSKMFQVNLTNVRQPLKTDSVSSYLSSSTEMLYSRPEINTQDNIESIGERCSDIGTISGGQSSAMCVENKYTTQDLLQKTLRFVENTGEENVWTFVSEDQGDVCVTADSPACSQCDSGISIPSSAISLEATDSLILSPIFDQDRMDFSENEHELFCDSCEDFHPRQKCSHSNCKQKKEARNSFLLGSVFERKESNPVVESSHVNIIYERNLPKSSGTSVSQLNNPSVIAPKGKRYLVQFKSKVVNHALNHGVKLAAEKFKVNRNTVAEWVAERKRFSGSAPVKHVDKDAAGDSVFLAWLEESKFNLTNELVKQKALEWLQMNDNNSCHQSQWLLMYANRLNGTEDVAVKKRYIVYPEAFKRAVVFHAQTHSNMAAARVFGIARKRVIDWQQSSGDGKGSSKNMNTSNVTDEAVDVQVFEWFCHQQPTPSSRQVRNKAVELYRAAGHSGIQCKSQWYYRWRARHKLPPSREQLQSEMTPLLIWTLSQLDNNKGVSQGALAAQAALLGHNKVARGWTFRFCKKYSALLQSLPAPDTPLPMVLEEQVCEFKTELQDLINTQRVTEDHIIALDEIPLHFLPKDKAKKPLLVRRPGFESCQASLMISCLADGTLLPTVFVFKGSGPDVSSSSDPRVIAFANDSGQVSDDMMQKWLSDVCFPQLSGRGVVVVDSFDVHVTPEVSQSVMSHNIHIAVTPPGCAFKLLPITPFCHTLKTTLEDMCQSWLSSQTAVLESPSPDMLYHWAVRAHKHVAKHCKEKIQSAFKSMLLPQSSQSTCS